MCNKGVHLLVKKFLILSKRTVQQYKLKTTYSVTQILMCLRKLPRMSLKTVKI